MFKRTLQALVPLALLAGCATSPTDEVFFAVGDSFMIVNDLVPQFVSAREDMTGGDVVVANAGVGGSASGDWLPGSANYARAVALFKQAIADNKGARPAAVIANLGVNDADGNHDASAWTANVTAMEAALRADIPELANARFVYGHLEPTRPVVWDTLTWTGWDSIGAQQDAYAKGRLRTMVECPDGPRQDPVHLTEVGAGIYARRFAEAVPVVRTVTAKP